MSKSAITDHPRRHRNRTLALLAVLLFGSGLATSQEKADLDAANRIRDAAMNHSQIMEMVGYLTDVTGPRLTGSPNLKKAEEYALDKLRQWGLGNAHLEAWGPFGRGWSLEGFTASMLSPGFSPLIAYPKAWSPGTKGAVRGEVVFLDAKTVADLDRFNGKLKGKIVLFAPARSVDALFDPPAHRQTDEELLQLANAPPSPDSRPFQWTPEQRAKAWDISKPVITPQVNVATEQYNRIVRLVARGIPVQLEVNIAVHFYDDDPMSYNVIAEIPGTDLKDEVVMVGGSIDSWHAATGATDNAAGAASALEVVRILQSLKVKPRRTIRIGLWSAEEQGTLGSHAYVAAHFGRKINAADGQTGGARFEFKPEYAKFDAYFNFDYGTGRIRGIFLQGNESARPIFRSLLEPFKDLGASTLSISGVGATDHVPFDEIGLPAFQWIRDYMEGNNTRAAHTNMDTYDHVIEGDLKQSAAVAAFLIYNLAMRDEKLPRKPLPSQ
ncbi:MAG TPA: M20/M25/M40 family metallo-hydrolase [Candidatus Angelobacter sp.]